LRILIAIGVSRQKEAGAAGVVLNHAAELTKRGHQVECWFLEDVLRQGGGSKRFEAVRFAKQVARRIQEEPGKFDVANLHAPWGCVYGKWRKRNGGLGGPPYVLTMQGSEERYVEMMRFEERKGRASNFEWKNRMWHRIYHQRMYDDSIRTADYGAVANREAWICAELKYKREPGRFWYVPNGTEERFFVAREYPEGSECNLLFVGTWVDRKGVYYLSDGFGLAAQKNPALRLTVAGCSAQEAEVKKMFGAEVRDRVTVIPFIKREEIVQLYTAHDIFVFPSLVEGMPLTLLEAMATGMPVITTNTSGMADVIEADVNGLLVPPANAEQLAQGIEELSESTELRKRLGLAGQETMRRYTWARIAEQMERVFVLAVNRQEQQRVS
jgi:glycosyltransferase involved in cell wall biosynthesis